MNAAKTCTIALIGGDTTEICSRRPLSPGTSQHGTTCADDAAYAFTGGGNTWTTTLSNGVAGTPVKS